MAELVYNPKHTEKENDSINMEHLVVPTVPQKPDIVLQLTKDDIEKGMKMTYLFDAKYRINDRTDTSVDTPPDDAINQMHRYRDAIYYKDNKDSDSSLKKEVIGGYILFPGNGDPIEVAKAKFQQSLDEVNIGAFPLRPNDVENRKLLEHFIEKLIVKASTEILDNSIPQKGLFYTSDKPKDAVYMILTLDKDVNEDIQGVINGLASCIIMGKKGMEEAKDIQSVRYIAPIIPGGHIEGYYKVTKANLKRVADAEYPIRIKFDVANWTKLEHPARFGMAKWAFRGVCKTREEFYKHCKEQELLGE